MNNNNNNDDKAVWLHANPSVIQHNILKDMETTLAGGKTITSPNNVASFMIESFSTLSANIMLDTLDELGTMFPSRITFADDLHKHMSDYDYVDMFSTPSTTNLEMLIELDTINEKAIWNVENTIGILKIPYGSKFMVGRYEYTIHHPIIIRVNSGTKTVTVVYDDSRPNPLHTIANNVVESRVFNDSGVDIVAIKIPVHQFARTEELEDVFVNTPFSRKYPFDSKFYAVRIHTNYTGSEVNGNNFYVDHKGVKWWELDQTFNEEVYDPDSNDPPTALISVDSEANILSLTIPFIYISRNRLGAQLKIEILTTEGEVDIDTEKLIGTALPTKFVLTGDINSDKYTIPLTVVNKVFVGVLNTRIAGGSNSMAFSELRRRVINSNYGEGILIVPGDVEAFLSDQGFRVSKFKDGITSRIFLCHKELTDKSGGIVASGVLSTMIDTSSTLEGVGTIRYFESDGSYTILPSAIYKYDEDRNLAIALSDSEISALNNMTNSDKVTQLNNNTYTHSPFYTKIAINNGIPIAHTYNLEDPTIESVTFKSESGMVQLSVYAAVIVFDPVYDSYNLTLDIICSNSDLRDAVGVEGETDHPVKMVMSTLDATNQLQYIEGEYTGDGAAGSMRFVFNMETTYRITNNNELSIKFDNSPTAALLDFNFDVDIVGYIAEDFPGITAGAGISNVTTSNLHPNMYAATHNVINITMADQVEEVFNAIDIAYESSTPETYDEDIYARHTSRIYARNPVTGEILHTSDGVITLTTEFEIGNYIIKDNSEQNVTLTNYDPELSTDISNYIGLLYLAIDNNHMHDVIITEDNVNSILIESAGAPINIAEPVVVGKKGMPILNSIGDITLADRDIHYRVSMIHINRKLLYTSDISKYANYVNTNEYITSLRKLILSHCDNVATSKDRLIPNTEIYYRPSRSIGKARFKVSSSDVSSHTLEIGVDLKLHVLRHVMNNQVLQSKIRDNVISIIDDHTTRLVFSLTEIANDIVKAMPQDVSSVDVVGIDGKHNDQTLVHVDDGAILNLKHYLKLERDGSISISRAIDIGFIASELEDVVDR